MRNETKTECCECGCGQRTERMIRALREQDLDTARRLPVLSIVEMLVRVPCVDGHEADGIEGYAYGYGDMPESDEGGAS